MPRRPTSSSSTRAATPRRRWRTSSGCARPRRAPASSPSRVRRDPDLILSVDARRRERVLHLAAAEDSVPRRDSPHGGAPRDRAGRAAAGDDAGVLRRQGRRRARRRSPVNCGVELARLSKRPTVIVDLKPGLGESVALFLGVRPRYSILDAIDNLHRLDREFLRELVVKHKSGLEILAGSDQLRSPRRGRRRRRSKSCSGCSARQYEYILVDAGSQINSCTVAALYTADQMFLVANPDVPSVRNAQRLLDRVRQLGACRRARARAAQPRRRAVSDSAEADREARSAIRFTTRSRATTRPCRRRSTPACRWRWPATPDIAAQFDRVHAADSRSERRTPVDAAEAQPARPRTHRVPLVNRP